MTELEKELEKEGKFFFEFFREKLKEVGCNPPLGWEHLTEKYKQAWIALAERAHDRYWG